jgi:putative hydrolases of HD superfamily
MTKRPTIERLFDLQEFLAAFSRIDRVVHRKHHNGSWTFETDTEHSYNLAMTAWYLADFFPELNKDLVIKYALVHDLPEVHAGDTFLFDTPEVLAGKADREAAAIKQLDQEWPDFQDALQHIHGYEKRETNEAKFVYALDKIMPIMTIYLNEGYSWEVKEITLEKLHDAKVDKVALSPEIQPYFESLHEVLQKAPHIIKPR